MTARPCLGHGDAILRADELLLLGHEIYIRLALKYHHTIQKKEMDTFRSQPNLFIEHDKRQTL